MNLRPAGPEHLAVIDEVCEDYRAMWSAMPNLRFPCDFRGSRTDVDALDYIRYEWGHHPRGLFGAALVWGNVLAKTGLFEWNLSDAGDYILFASEDRRIVIWPYARVVELEHSTCPQFGKFEWLLEEAVARCLVQGLDDDNQRKLLAVLDPCPGDGFSHFVSGAAELIQKAGNDA